MGKYFLKTHESKENWIRLNPFSQNNMKNRDGFAIHGRGFRGSDGCIVPADFNIVKLLYKLTLNREKNGLSAPTLAVFAIGDFESYDKRLAMLSSLA